MIFNLFIFFILRVSSPVQATEDAAVEETSPEDAAVEEDAPEEAAVQEE